MTGLVTIAVYGKPNKKQSLPSSIPRNSQASAGGEGGIKALLSLKEEAIHSFLLISRRTNVQLDQLGRSSLIRYLS